MANRTRRENNQGVRAKVAPAAFKADATNDSLRWLVGVFLVPCRCV